MSDVGFTMTVSPSSVSDRYKLQVSLRGNYVWSTLIPALGVSEDAATNIGWSLFARHMQEGLQDAY